MIDVKKLRSELGINQSELARLSGLTRATIFNIENDRHAITVESAKKLSAILGVNWSDFFED